MKEMTNLDIIFKLYEKPYIKKEKKKNSYHEITNFDIICYVSKKIEERSRIKKEFQKNNSNEIKNSVLNNGKLEISK